MELGGWIEAWIRVVGNDERIDNVLQWFGHAERMEKDRVAKRVYVGDCAGSHSVDRPQMRWIDTVKDCSRKRGWMLGKQGEWCRLGMNGRGL